MKENTVRVFVFIDALGWKQAERYGFLRDLLPNRRPIEMQFGYSCTAIPTILTGERPAVHGHLAFYDWAPEKSPFRAMRWIAPFLRPRSFWRRGRVRNVLSRLVKKLYGFTGYFQLYAVPLERLPKLDYCEKRDMFVPGGLAPVPNLADAWEGQGMRWHVSDWRKPEEENFRVAEALLAKGALDRAFVYAAAFDALQHDRVGDDDALRPAAERYAGLVRSLHAALVAAGRPFELTVVSDHGMTPLRGTADVPGALERAGLRWGRDYAGAVGRGRAARDPRALALARGHGAARPVAGGPQVRRRDPARGRRRAVLPLRHGREAPRGDARLRPGGRGLDRLLALDRARPRRRRPRLRLLPRDDRAGFAGH